MISTICRFPQYRLHHNCEFPNSAPLWGQLALAAKLKASGQPYASRAIAFVQITGGRCVRRGA